MVCSLLFDWIKLFKKTWTTPKEEGIQTTNLNSSFPGNINALPEGINAKIKVTLVA